MSFKTLEMQSRVALSQSLCRATALLILLLLFCVGVGRGERVALPSNRRATWIPVSAQQWPNITVEDLKLLYSLGVRRLYVDVWNDGRVYFNSSTMTSLLPDGSGYAGDHLGAFLTAASSVGDFEVVAWFEYGFMGGYLVSNPFLAAAEARGWILGVTANNFTYLDPANGDVLRFVVGLMSDLLATYPSVMGVQLDDHFDCPVVFPSCNTSTMNHAAAVVSQGLGRNKVFLAPTTAWYALTSFSVDWPYWMNNESWFAELAVQLYYLNSTEFSSVLHDTLSVCDATTRGVLSIGIRVDSNPMTEWADVVAMIHETVASGLGVVIWYSESILQTYRAEFVQLWNDTASSV